MHIYMTSSSEGHVDTSETILVRIIMACYQGDHSGNWCHGVEWGHQHWDFWNDGSLVMVNLLSIIWMEWKLRGNAKLPDDFNQLWVVGILHVSDQIYTFQNINDFKAAIKIWNNFTHLPKYDLDWSDKFQCKIHMFSIHFKITKLPCKLFLIECSSSGFHFHLFSFPTYPQSTIKYILIIFWSLTMVLVC